MTQRREFLIALDIANERDTLISVRRHLHAHPELANQEFETQKFVIGFLTDRGICAEPLGGTGVLATIPGKSAKPLLLLRADMDALPITEQCEIPYKSQNSGVMHACGHDAHTAIMLVAASVLSKRPPENGTVRILFQPAEEGGGGAKAMIEAGALSNPTPDAALALHVWSMFPTGEIAVIDGPAMAAVDGFEICVSGRGTHGASPEDGVDPVAISAALITSAQQIISRTKPVHQAAVLSFCAINGGSTFNIIPDSVTIKGTLRTFDSGLRTRLRASLDNLVTNFCSAMGARGDICYFEELGPTVNNPMIANLVRLTASRIVGDSRVTSPLPLMAGEDMGRILEQIPGAIFFVGCGNADKGAHFPHHHPRFTIDEDALLPAAAVVIESAQNFFSGGDHDIF